MSQYVGETGLSFIFSKIKSTFIQKDGNKVLSDNNYSTAEKTKLAGLKSNVQSDWNADSGDAQILNKPTIPQTASDIGAISTESKGVAMGVATLDSAGKIPSSQLPSYVDDVVEGYLHDGKFYTDETYTVEIEAEKGKIYVDLTDNRAYRWSGTIYIAIVDERMTALTNDEIEDIWDSAE